MKLTNLDKQQILYSMLNTCLIDQWYVYYYAKAAIAWFEDYQSWINLLNQRANDPEYYNNGIKIAKHRQGCTEFIYNEEK